MSRYLFLLMILVFSCKTQEKINFSTYTEPYLIFQSGGGFAGTYNTYILLKSGEIYEKSFDEISTYPIGKVNTRAAKQLYKNYDLLNFDAIEHEKYGNYTYSIKRNTGDKTHQIIWQKGDEGTKTLQIYFKNAVSIISKSIQKSPQHNGVKH